MSQRLRRQLVGFVCLATVLVVSSAFPISAQAPTKRPLSYDAVDYWRSIGGTRLSEDGQWLAYALSSRSEDGTLVVRNLTSGQEFRHPRGSAPNFTPDGKFVVFTIVPPKAEDDDEAPAGRGGGAGNGGAARNSAGIMALPSGQVTEVEQVNSIELADESSVWLAMHKGKAPAGERGGRGGGAAEKPATEEEVEEGKDDAPAEKKKDAGTELVVRNLTTGQDVSIADVSEFAWGKGGAWLAYAVSSADAAKDGAFVRQMSDGAVTTLHSGRGNYKRLAFDDAGTQLAFLSDQAEYQEPVAPYRLYYWSAGDGSASEIVSGTTNGMPSGMVVHDSAPRFSDDGERLLLNTAPPPPPPADPKAKKPLDVDLWSYLDPQLQPMQQVRASQDRNRSYRAVFHVDNKRLVQLATPDLPTVNPGAQPDVAIGTSDVPYQHLISWDQRYNDIYVVDLENGQRRKILERSPQSASLSPGGEYLLFFDETEAAWYSQRLSDGVRVNLTGQLPVNFYQEDHDTPDVPSSYGSPGWTEGDRSVLLYDQYDIWEIRPDGSNARNVTGGQGRSQQLVFRYRSLDPDLNTVPTDTPVLLNTINDDTKASGYYRVTLSGNTAPEKVVMLDKAFGTVTKAKRSDRFVFTLSRFDEFPNLWVSDAEFGNMSKVSDANPQQAEYVWGNSELVEYVNADGITLKAILTKPDNFDPTKKYPMMVYIYEELSQGLHRYSAPNVGTSVNLTRYVSNGYVVLQPDIIYNTGYPGEDSEKCVIPAVNSILEQGYIDEARVGIQGHSWGGYQISHLITRTDMFAAVEAGASVVNMTSAYGGIRWDSGMSRAFQYEKTQSRIGGTPWDSPLQFIENSPLFWVEKVNTPYLTIHNDADGAVPWYQGIEFMSALRRLGKESYMFNYNGEPHGLRNRDNQKHWTVHMDEFFDHYLLGAPRPDWMTNGVPFLERGTRDVSELFKRDTPAPAGGGGR